MRLFACLHSIYMLISMFMMSMIVIVEILNFKFICSNVVKAWLSTFKINLNKFNNLFLFVKSLFEVYSLEYCKSIFSL